MLDRREVVIPIRQTHIAAWHYRAAAVAARPCVVMAHGFGLTRHAGLDAYAQRFCNAGFDVVVFDYRHFGDSGGEPRQLFDAWMQREDWNAAVAFARSIPDVPPTGLRCGVRRSAAGT
jgi:uncharacterized protein